MEEKIEAFCRYLKNIFPKLDTIKHTFEQCSKYDDNKFLVNCNINTINFDKLTEWYLNPKPQSADSLSFSQKYAYLIEFKSGNPTRHERKLEKLIADVIGKINDSDITLSKMYENAFKNTTDRLHQRFALVVDSKMMGITAITSTLAALSLTENPGVNHQEKILFEKVLPELKQSAREKGHYDRIDIWYSEFFEDYISNYNIRSSIG